MAIKHVEMYGEKPPVQEPGTGSLRKRVKGLEDMVY